MTDTPDRGLFGHTEETYPGAFQADLLEQYKLYVQSAENVSARRLASSRYLLAVNAALVALYGFQAQGPGFLWLTLLLPILGIPVSLLWLGIIRSHTKLNEVKFKIIHELEEHLPAALFTHEWRLANPGKGRPYRPVTQIERLIPLVFLALHLVLLLLYGLRALSTGGMLTSG
ncbi:MAG: hypothetical protein OXH59_10085 [Rhodospirillaceae bacterium]|nr:hypothetical protein [Rhodospirillaceae bacterium]